MNLHLFVFACCIAASACGERHGPLPRARHDGLPARRADARPPLARQIAPKRELAAARAEVELAAEPAMDLLDNRFLWHLHRPGLVIPLASEGLRKYTQEYAQPWGRLLEVEGRAGRLLAARAATLRFPWDRGGAASARLRLHGAAAGQRITLIVNGKQVATVAAGPAWQASRVDLGALRRGENELRLYVGKRGQWNGHATYGLYHSIEITDAAADRSSESAARAGDSDWPSLSPAGALRLGGDRKLSLIGFPELRLLVEIPQAAWLLLDTGVESGRARFRVTATAIGGQPRALLDITHEGGRWQAHRLPLAPLAGRLVSLEFHTDGDARAAWGAPRIVLAQAPLLARGKPVENAILLVVDALRSDRLAVYGKTRVRTPRITQEVSRGGAVFLHNQAASPSSPPSHASLQTGMIPRVHGVTGDKAQLRPDTPMISTQLGGASVATAYYGNNPFGMARLRRPGRWTAFHQPSQEGKGIDCVALVDEMLGFARRQAQANKRFFISALAYEPHTPYRYHEGISDRYHPGPWEPPVGKLVDGHLLSALSRGDVTLSPAQWNQLKALYDGEVEYMDGCFARLQDGLAALGVARQTLVVLTSDHGEGMFEHGRMGHAFGHFSELADVPLILFVPGLVRKRTIVETVSSHLDIAPTVLDLMGVRPSDRIQGESLVPILLRQGPWLPRVVSLEYGRSYALRARRWKYIVDYGGDESLYDLENDPTEQHDAKEKYPLAFRYMRDLAGFFLAHRERWRAGQWGSLNNHRAGFLRSVGAGDE